MRVSVVLAVVVVMVVVMVVVRVITLDSLTIAELSSCIDEPVRPDQRARTQDRRDEAVVHVRPLAHAAVV